MKKPQFLYHASQYKNLDIIEPRAESVRDQEEGPVIFASPDKAICTIFLVKTDDSWCRSGRFGGVPYFVCDDEDRFREMDKGGAIYKLDSNDFHFDPKKGLGVNEWMSKVSTKPISKDIYNLGLIAMLDNGVQVYFVDPEEFAKITLSDDHGNQLLRNCPSENKKRNINVLNLPEVDPR